MATSSEPSGSLAHVDAFSDRGGSEKSRLLNITVETHDTADIESSLSSASSSNSELLDGKCFHGYGSAY